MRAKQFFADAKEGDTLAVFSTGAYNYPMANYNRLPLPWAALENDDKAELKRQSFGDLIPGWL